MRQFLTSHAFGIKGSTKLPSGSGTSISARWITSARTRIGIYTALTRPSQCNIPLHAIESRELRFYRSSVVLEKEHMNGLPFNIVAGSSGGSSSGDGSASTKNGKMFSVVNNLSTSPLEYQELSNLFGKNNGRNEQLTSILTEHKQPKPPNGRGLQIQLTPEEEQLFNLLIEVIHDSPEITSTLRVAGGWVRDKLLATEEFKRGHYDDNGMEGDGSGSNNNNGSVDLDRLTSKFKGPSSGRQGSKLIGVASSSSSSSTSRPLSLVDDNGVPVDIDIALDDMLGREFADHLNDWLANHGGDKISVGVVLKNPEKSKHLETATMKVGKFWIDFVNLRAEEYTEDSRIPDLMRIGTAQEDALRRDLTINSLFYNINTGEVEDFTGKGFDDLKRGIVATPLPALTTLLDDPLRVLRSVRFAARLRFTMDESLHEAAKTESVRKALAQKVARERVGSEVDLMLRSQDPVGAMRLILNLNLTSVVFPVSSLENDGQLFQSIFEDGLHLLTTTHDHLCDCKISTPVWCEKTRVSKSSTNGVDDLVLIQDDESRRMLWFAALLKPLRDHYKNLGQAETVEAGTRQGKKSSRSVIMKILVDELKRPLRDAKAVELVMKAADDLTGLLNAGCALSATSCLLNDVRIESHDDKTVTCYMGGRQIDSDMEDDPEWSQAMEYRLLVSKVLQRAGPLWRASMILSLSEQLAVMEDDQLSYTIEGDVFEESQGEERDGMIQKYDHFAASILQLGLVGIWSQDPLINGKMITADDILPNAPIGPVFREIMDEQTNWMTTHPGGTREGLVENLREVFSEYI